MIGYQPKGYRALCELIQVKTINGLAMPFETGGNGESHQKITGYWKVIAIGDPKTVDGEKIPLPCEVGDVILVEGAKAFFLEPPMLFDGRKLLVVNGEGIQGILKNIDLDDDGNLKSAGPGPVKMYVPAPKRLLSH